MMKSDRQASLHVIDDLDALRMLADPLRSHILELLIIEPLPVKQIAERLGLAPNKLYYHVNLLEQHGLIEVADTRMVSGIIEKTYRAVAESYTVDSQLISPRTEQGRESLFATVSAVLDATRDDLLRSLEARYAAGGPDAAHPARTAMVNRSQKRLSQTDAKRFMRRLKRLVDDFDKADEPEPEAQTFGLTIVCYPSFYFPEDDTQSER